MWDGDGADGLWSNPANWLGGVVPSANDDLIFRQAAVTETDNDLAAGTVFRSLWFLADDYSVGGNALGVSQRIMVGPGAGGASIAADVSLVGSVHATIVGGPLWLSGELFGSGSLDVNGNGVVELANTAAYTGNTTIHDGATVRLGSLDALPSGPGAGTVTVDGSLDLGGWSATLNGLGGSGVITSSAPGPLTLTVDTTGQSSTFSGVIEDGAARVDLTTTGTGTFTLSGANTFTGVVTIEAGSTLRVGGPDALSGDPEVNGTLDLAGYDTTLDGLWGSGTITSSVSGSVTLSVDASNYWGTFSGVIEDGSGTMAVAIIGTGRQTFAGANTYSGGTTIEPYATLRVAGTQGTLGSGDVTADDGYGGYGGPAELVFDRDAGLTVGNDITGSLHVDQQGSGTIVLSGTNSYTGGTTVASGKTLKVGSNTGLGDGGTATVNGTLDLNGYSSSVGELAGSGTVTSGVSGTAALAVNVEESEESTFPGVIQDGSGTVSLVKSGSGTLYLTGNNTYSGGTTISGGTLYVGDYTFGGTLGSAAVVNNATLGFRRSGLTVGNAISGSGSVVQEYGTVTLTGANTYSGGTTIEPYATLRVAGTQGTLGSGDVTADDGYGGYGGLAELVFDRDAGLTVGNNITGSIHVTQQGSGTIVLSGTNTYTGGTTVASGKTLGVGSNNALASGTATVNGTLDLNGYSPSVAGLAGSGTVTSGVAGTAVLAVDLGEAEDSRFSGVIQDGSGAVSLVKAGSGELYLTGSNTYSGGTTISGGTLYVGEWSASGTLGSGAVTNNATLAFRRTGLTVGNAISGSGSVLQEYATVTLTGANTYSGGTTIQPNAILRVGGTQGTLGSGDVTADDGYGGYGGLGELVFDRDASLTVANNITGSIHVTQQGSGAIVLSGTNTYIGGTTVTGGKTLRVGSNSGLGSGGTATVNGTLDLNGYSPSVGGLAGSGTVTSGVSGTAALTVNLAEDSTFPGVSLLVLL